MKFRDVKTELYQHNNRVAKRQGWQTEKLVDKQTINSVNESDQKADDWVVLEKIND